MLSEHDMVYKRINITLPEETLEKVKSYAEKEDRPLSNVIKHCIEFYLEHHKNK